MFNKEELAYLMHAVDALPSAGNPIAARNKAVLLMKITDLLQQEEPTEDDGDRN